MRNIIHRVIILFIILCAVPFSSANNSTNTSENSSEIECGNFSIIGLKEIYFDEEKIKYSFLGFEEGDSITYWIEDLFGEIWKKAYTSANNNKKTYTPKIEEKDRILLLKAEREREGCDVARSEAKIIVIKEISEEQEIENSTVNSTQEHTNTTKDSKEEDDDLIEEEVKEDIDIKYYDDEVESGKNMHVELTIQKNSNRNNAFYLWIENEEKEKNGEIKINIHDKGSYEIEIDFPIHLEECGNAFEKKYLHFLGLGEEEEEKVYVLQKACPEIQEEKCAELTITNDILLEENPINSFYARAKKWQKNVSLYTHVDKEMQAWIIGPLSKYKKLEIGTNTITISPRVGNNTFALINEKGQGKIVHFYLEGEEKTEEKTEETPLYRFSAKNSSKETNITKNTITGEVIYTTKEKKNVPLLLSLILISIIGLIYTKWKALRNKNHSKEAWQTKSSTKKTSKKKSTKDIYTQTSYSK